MNQEIKIKTMPPLTTTAYIPTKITINDKPAKGWIIALTKEGRGVPYYFDGSDISFITMRDQYDVWLRPVDLSRMLEEAFKRGWYDRGYDRKPLKEYMDDHINSVLNPPK